MRQRQVMPVPDNLSQCQLDARQNVVNSVFLNTQVVRLVPQHIVVALWRAYCPTRIVLRVVTFHRRLRLFVSLLSVVLS